MERRVAALLSAGVHEFSRLMNGDEEQTVRTLTAYRETIAAIIDQHHGRVVNAPGEKIMTEFGSAADAVMAAVAIQSALGERNAQLPSHRQMLFCIGVNLGDVIVDGDALYGDGVNVAARVEAIANGGEICISQPIYDQLAYQLDASSPLQQADYIDLGTHSVKNISRPIHVYRVVYRDEGHTDDIITTPNEQEHLHNVADSPEPLQTLPSTPTMVGRGAELETLVVCAEAALQAERQIVFVTGEPGIGKTTLIEAFLSDPAQQGELWTGYGQCVEQYGQGEAYLPVLEALGRLGRGHYRSKLVSVLSVHAPTWLVQLPTLIPPEEQAVLRQNNPNVSQERMLREMAEALEVLTEERGLVLILEDLHWSDVSTLELLVYLARRRKPAKLLVIGTYRPTDLLKSGHPLRGTVKELQARGQCMELRLSPLTEAGIQQYLDAKFEGAQFPEAMTRAVQRRTGGNPLFMINVVDDLIQQGVVVKRTGSWTVDESRDLTAESVPENLRQLIDRQLGRLTQDEQTMLEVASVVGREFSTAAAAAGLQVDAEAIEDACEQFARTSQLIEAQGIEEWPDGTLGARYQFRHAVYQEVLYNRMAESRRVRFHRRIAECKEAAYSDNPRAIAGELALHFEKGRVAARAIVYCRRAGENAVQRSAHHEAISHFRKGQTFLERLQPGAERDNLELRLLTALGVSIMATQGYAAPDAVDVYLQAREVSKRLNDPPQLFAVLSGLWVCYSTQAQFKSGYSLALQTLELAERLNRPTSLLWAHSFVGQAFFYQGQFATGKTHFDAALSIYDPRKHSPRVSPSPQDPGETSMAYWALSQWMLGYPDQAEQKSLEARALSRDLEHPLTLAHATSLAAWLYQLRGEARQTLECAAEVIQLLGEDGSTYRTGQATILHGWALAVQGNTERGIAQIREGLDAWRGTGAETSVPHYLALLAIAYQRAGQIGTGLETVNEALTVSHRTNEIRHDAELYRLKGELLLQSQAQEAEICFQKALEIARQQEAKMFELRAAVWLGRLWQQQGKADEARQLIQEVYTWFTEGFETKDLQQAAELLTDLGGPVERLHDEKPDQSTTQSEETTQQPEPSPPIFRTPQDTEEDPLPATPSQPAQPLPTEPVVPSPLERSELVFRREGEYWSVVFHADTIQIKHTRGMQYLAHLLAHPEREFHVLDLAGGGQTSARAIEREAVAEHATAEVIGDAGEMLDPQAQAAYRQRLKDLQVELEEAQEFNDVGRVDQLQTELDFLTRELSQAVGLGGRARKAASSSERARVNVTRAIRTAIKRIKDSHPNCGTYLSRTIKTGAFCVYMPTVRQ